MCIWYLPNTPQQLYRYINLLSLCSSQESAIRLCPFQSVSHIHSISLEIYFNIILQIKSESSTWYLPLWYISQNFSFASFRCWSFTFIRRVILDVSTDVSEERTENGDSTLLRNVGWCTAYKRGRATSKPSPSWKTEISYAFLVSACVLYVHLPHS
jgi:hypothetical protein